MLADILSFRISTTVHAPSAPLNGALVSLQPGYTATCASPSRGMLGSMHAEFTLKCLPMTLA